MATEKIYLALIVVLPLLILSVEGRNRHIKYNEISSNFLDTNVNINEAIEFASAIAEGEIIKVERKFKKNIPIWKINMITVSGGTLDIEISYQDKRLIRLDANEGPFNYDINTNENLISFSDAKRSAEEYAAQSTLKWNLVQNRDKWEYNFWLFTKSGRAQVRIDAQSGEINTGRKKNKKN